MRSLFACAWRRTAFEERIREEPTCPPSQQRWLPPCASPEGFSAPGRLKFHRLSADFSKRPLAGALRNAVLRQVSKLAVKGLPWRASESTRLPRASRCHLLPNLNSAPSAMTTTVTMSGHLRSFFLSLPSSARGSPATRKQHARPQADTITTSLAHLRAASRSMRGVSQRD